ncbi:MAG TPA: hypothetical protein VLG92_02600 [Candidatus Saccharimonadia bacterium]|nr:hypothetical protein [Candidatus Saccharimonadia bacterium]
MYKPGLLFDRTPKEKRDMFASWKRDDQAFFAAGACHILADLFVQLHMHEGFRMIHIKPDEGFTGNHVYASNGEWAFDHNGWTKETDLLIATEEAYQQKYPGWSYTKHTIQPTIDALENFCKANNHRLPWQFAYLPWERAYSYIKRLPESPPV